MEWQPIETAPKGDDRFSSPVVLLLSFTDLDEYETSVAVGFWSTIDAHAEDQREGWCNWGAGMNDDDFWEEVKEPTHWMPLPAPPECK